jgi:hypothetical protein
MLYLPYRKEPVIDMAMPLGIFLSSHLYIEKKCVNASCDI